MKRILRWAGGTLGRAQPVAAVSLLAGILSWVTQLGSGAVEHEEEQVSSYCRLPELGLHTIAECCSSRFFLSTFMPKVPQQEAVVSWHNDEAHVYAQSAATKSCFQVAL